MSDKIRVAAIDIGTNTILMLITEFDKSGIYSVLADVHRIPRLGENLNSSGQISNDAFDRAKECLMEYKKKCDELNVKLIYAVGTSALREAKNGVSTAKKLSAILGSEVKIISGDEEARLSLLGATKYDGDVIVIDIGGGSTEIIAGKDNLIYDRISLNIGVVKLSEKYIKRHPPTKTELYNISVEIENELRKLPEFKKIDIKGKGIRKVYAVAGTPTTIAAVLLGLKDFEIDKIHGFKCTINEINRAIEIFESHSIEEIINIYYVHPKRADVIIVGALILKKILVKIDADECIVSAHGLRYGIIKEIIKNYKFNKD
jgi:exopolyphosphatase/guanosine-5'-triphosphate,3'-diphosphate pyrophosphatase